MPSHDIIDNREEILLDHVKGLLRNLKELKILIGNITNKKTIEQTGDD